MTLKTVTRSATDTHRPVAVWLLVCCVLIFVMVVLGGVTRLTRSGLSIVEWQPIAGAIPPLTEQAWETEFAKYRLTPEYRKINFGIGLSQFKSIYWVEYTHRLLGRLIGAAFLLPFLYFWIRRRLDRPLVCKLAALFVLGGLQGALGWYMVASGLIDNPRVSPYRLTAHLGLAVLIYGYLFWIALGLLVRKPPAATAQPLWRFGLAVTALVFVTILAGGFVAGTHAGFVFNTFPLMHGQFVPAGAYSLSPWWRDLFENVATVQFNHRLLAYALLIAVPLLWFKALRARVAAPARRAAHWLLAALLLQVTLGIATLLHAVPIPLAAAHQGGALLVFSAALYFLHSLKTARP
jgi:cytochrome c oxidase assembly protein subunit 15